MASPWKRYQEEAAEFFRSLGLHASTDVTLQGIRTKHDIDVLVKSSHVGFEITWLVECKCWQTPVSKLHVLALREIVADLGADRGILLAEAGFQSGAIEAATLTNVHVTSILELAGTAKSDIYAMRLRELYDRVETAKERYWDIPKDIRIQTGLRSEVGEHDYSGAAVVEVCTDILSRAFRGLYPIEIDRFMQFKKPGLPDRFIDAEDVVRALEPMVAELEGKLEACPWPPARS
jgi:restriction system protein